MKNRFNNITSKEWLPFQKSWFLHTNNEQLYSQHIRFFIKYDDPDSPPNFIYFGNDSFTVKNVCNDNGAKLLHTIPDDKCIQYVFIDLRDKINALKSIDEYSKLRKKILIFTQKLFKVLKERRFISIIIPNKTINNKYVPFAWDFAYSIASGFTLKDEKVGCINKNKSTGPTNSVYYVLNFRKDENSSNNFKIIDSNLLNGKKIHKDTPIIYPKMWDIIKPPPRKKNEVLHPAKYPENLITSFIKVFTNKSDNVFDPMSGSGSTQMAALQVERNGYGTELSEYFSKIAKDRLEEYLRPKKQSVFLNDTKNLDFKILNKDIRNISEGDFPLIDYIITSPPYWDMLNMKGAEYQARRKEKGLKLNYSDSNNDLGNIEDYNLFIKDLVDIYYGLIDILKPGGYFTIIVKNIKKKGKNYPFAWDLTRMLNNKLILLPEFFWLQDDINLAPYGYGNTFVSNTFHQYCLNFMKPNIRYGSTNI